MDTKNELRPTDPESSRRAESVPMSPQNSLYAAVDPITPPELGDTAGAGEDIPLDSLLNPLHVDSLLNQVR